MATNITYVGDDATLIYNIPFTVPAFSEVDVRLDGVLQSSGYTHDRVGQRIVFDAAPDNGVAINLRRRTPNVVTHKFGAGAAFNPYTLDDNFNQVLRRAEEVEDGAVLVEFGLPGDVDANGHRILNLSPATAPGHAVTWEQFRPFEQEFDSAQAQRELEFQDSQNDRAETFLEEQSVRSTEWLEFLSELGYKDIGEYEAGLVLNTYNEVFSYGETGYRLSGLVDLPYTLAGEWSVDAPKLVQIQFVTTRAMREERLARIAGDANLQAQISGGQPLEASAFSPISWHAQVIQNSVTIPDNVNAWSFGPEMTIAAGQGVTIGSGSFWTIANGEQH